VKRRVLLLAIAAAAGCIPDVPSTDAIVSAPRILAVRGDPAEAKPGTPVVYTPLVAGPGGTVVSPAVVWAYCLAPKPLTDDDVVSTACLGMGPLDPLGAGASVTAPLPANACSLFGPVTPAGGGRPRDPDSTGGYYQPLRADLAGASTVFALERIACDLADAPAAEATAFAAAYTLNANPQLAPLQATAGAMPVSLDQVLAGSRVALTASWPPSSAETYAYYDAASNTVTSHREAMQVAWYTTSGTLDEETTQRAEDDPSTTSDNTWTAPPAPGPAHLWIVLRDSRGGVDFATYDVTVRAPGSQ
jgi:hypothetical protein